MPLNLPRCLPFALLFRDHIRPARPPPLSLHPPRARSLPPSPNPTSPTPFPNSPHSNPVRGRVDEKRGRFAVDVRPRAISTNMYTGTPFSACHGPLPSPPSPCNSVPRSPPPPPLTPPTPPHTCLHVVRPALIRQPALQQAGETTTHTYPTRRPPLDVPTHRYRTPHPARLAPPSPPPTYSIAVPIECPLRSSPPLLSSFLYIPFFSLPLF
jgi:hypothetical protein